MAQSSFPTGGASVRSVSDAQYEILASQWCAPGVIGSPADTSVAYADGTGTRVVKIRANKRAQLRGWGWDSGTTDYSMTSLGANGTGSIRYDLIVLQFSRTAFTITTQSKAGTAGAGVPPALQQDVPPAAGLYEIPIARVQVDPGATTLSADKVVSMTQYISPGRLICTSTTRPAGLPYGTEIMETDTGATHWWNGTIWVPNSGALVRYARLQPGSNLASGINSETTIFSTTVPSGVFQNGVSYEVHVEASSSTGVAIPGDLASYVTIKAAGTQIAQGPFNQLKFQGSKRRNICTGIYAATSSTTAVTFTVTAGASWSGTIFDILGTSADPLVFTIKALGLTSQLVTS